MSRGEANCPCRQRNASRINRLDRDLTTEPPTRLLAITPRREKGRSEEGLQFMIMVREKARWPEALREANSHE